MNVQVPKYIAISKDIIKRIESGDLQPGDKIPSENELIKNYRISNTTARKSLHEIELQGWAARIKGKGTFVLNRTADKHITRVLGSFNAIKESFTNNLIREGFAPKNIILEKVILENGISSEINNRHLIIDGPVLKIHRLRYGNDVLLKDETKYISMTVCPKIHMLDLEKPLIGIYHKEYSLQLEKVQRSLSNMIMFPSDKNNYFENEIPLAVFILDGAILCSDDKVVEIEKSYYRGDRYKFSIDVKPEMY
ncbi:GntR family transcriptional regulator [Prolixibacteraceae bacterium Z1-6]|uniref:GntR family transcriptional regulator n=1 Tax=Draconibacterium aestuarii TaxID=2998507 RepID=A0A9X3J6X5_9BACT|nr:GntR family transcriptional regulator [Prolixibacteraceae bacterium Z1-6]